MNYTKMQALKNDFIVFKGPLEMSERQVAGLCDRAIGIGADGVLVVTKNAHGQVEMDYRNADGSKAEMCGNGLRCAARFALDNGLATSQKFVVITQVGPLKVNCKDDEVQAQIGKVQFEAVPTTIQNKSFYIASVGNPHAITFVDDAGSAEVANIGPQVEHDEHFPRRTNVEFVEVIDSDHLKMRVWERGVGETQACGTGIVAAATVASKIKGTHMPIFVQMPGGTGRAWIDDEGYASLSSPVETVMSGHLE